MTKLTFLGAGGIRTPLVIQSILARQEEIGLTTLGLMDIDAEYLDLMQMLCEPLLRDAPFKVLWTTDAREAIKDSDYVVTTFRVGGMASRVIDEQVPLKYGVLGQETTGPGGFAMAMRTIPVVLGYVEMVRELAPDAWFLNFTNPAGIVTQAIINAGGYARAVGICDNPSAMWRAAAELLKVHPDELVLEYFGLNHLGWVKAVHHGGKDRLWELMAIARKLPGGFPHLPFDMDFIEALGLWPNEYNMFYYENRRAVDNLLKAGQSRAQQIMPFNLELMEKLRDIRKRGAPVEEAEAAYMDYLFKRHVTYMSIETGSAQDEAHRASLREHLAAMGMGDAAEGYSGVALSVIAGLDGKTPHTIILNVPNRGAIPGMASDDVVEVTCYVGNGVVLPLAPGEVPGHALGLIQQVKAYERLTIEAAVQGSYATAVKALALHPLVPSYGVARAILDDYIEQHGDYFPQLS
jgi:6-phospho-beta-glucosidase